DEAAPPGDDPGAATDASATSDTATSIAASSPRASDGDQPVRPYLTPAGFFAELATTGATANRMTVLWNPARPLQIPQRPFLDAAAIAATAHGIDVILSVRGE